VNLKVAFFLGQAAAKHFVAQKHGKIISEESKVGPIVKTTDWPKEMKPYSASQPGVLWA
jgi:hypothetical protein